VVFQYFTLAGDYKDYLPQKTDVINGMTVTYRMVDDAVYLASWEIHHL